MAARTVVASGRLALGGGPLAAASRPRLRAPRQRGRVEWGERVDRCTGRVARVASGRVSRGDSTLHGVHSPGRVAARGVHSPRGVGPLGAASRPGRRSTRPGESTAASTCAAATFSAGPSYPPWRKLWPCPLGIAYNGALRRHLRLEPGACIEYFTASQAEKGVSKMASVISCLSPRDININDVRASPAGRGFTTSPAKCTRGTSYCSAANTTQATSPSFSPSQGASRAGCSRHRRAIVTSPCRVCARGAGWDHIGDGR